MRFIRNNVITTYHYAGTCRMGSGPDAVVDDRLRVRGVSGLRVADASVIPSVPVSALNAPSMLIGYRVAVRGRIGDEHVRPRGGFVALAIDRERRLPGRDVVELFMRQVRIFGVRLDDVAAALVRHVRVAAKGSDPQRVPDREPGERPGSR